MDHDDDDEPLSKVVELSNETGEHRYDYDCVLETSPNLRNSADWW